MRWLLMDDNGLQTPPTCVSSDPRFDTPDYNLLPVVEPGTDNPQYGLLGYQSLRQDDGSFSHLYNWLTCPTNDYIDGPEVEGLAQSEPYTRRWVVVLDTINGAVRYGRVGDSLAAAPADLFPAPIYNAINITLSFDSNARPVFAYELPAGTVTIARYVAGVPTFTTIAGASSPKLFFDGILQPDTSLQDVVIFVVASGRTPILRTYFQRDNFGIPYQPTVLTTIPGIITKIDRFGFYHNIFFNGADGNHYMLESYLYPVITDDQSAFSLPVIGGEYSEIVIPGGSYVDSGSFAVSILSGSYLGSIVTTGPYGDDSGFASAVLAGNYVLTVVMPSLPSSDASSFAVDTIGGTYDLVVVAGGSYSDAAGFSLSVLSGNYF